MSFKTTIAVKSFRENKRFVCCFEQFLSCTEAVMTLHFIRVRLPKTKSRVWMFPTDVNQDCFLMTQNARFTHLCTNLIHSSGASFNVRLHNYSVMLCRNMHRRSLESAGEGDNNVPCFLWSLRIFWQTLTIAIIHRSWCNCAVASLVSWRNNKDSNRQAKWDLSGILFLTLACKFAWNKPGGVKKQGLSLEQGRGTLVSLPRKSNLTHNDIRGLYVITHVQNCSAFPIVRLSRK